VCFLHKSVFDGAGIEKVAENAEQGMKQACLWRFVRK
jgi:hypothetical protein